MDLQTLANVAQILGATAVVSQAVFLGARAKIRQFRLQRRDSAAAELVSPVCDNIEFSRSFR